MDLLQVKQSAKGFANNATCDILNKSLYQQYTESTETRDVSQWDNRAILSQMSSHIYHLDKIYANITESNNRIQKVPVVLAYFS